MIHSLLKDLNVDLNPQYFKKNDDVFYLGQKTECIYYVVKGLVQLFRDDLNGHRVILHQASSGHFFAEASINSDNYHCTATCMVDSELHAINIKSFCTLLNTNPQFSRAWVNHLSTELRRQRASVERLNLKTAAEKITHYISTEGDNKGVLTLNSTLSELADIIGLSRESLYRTLSKMKKDNLIAQSNNNLRLL